VGSGSIGLDPRRLFHGIGQAMLVELKPLAAADIAFVARCLSLPHVREGWELPSTAAEIAELLTSGHDRAFIVHAAGRPVGFAHAYNCYAQPDPIRSEKDPPQTWGFGIAIGDVAMLRKGIATAVVAELAVILPELCNCARFIVELRADNVAGIALLARSDFQTVAWIDDDPARASQIMVRNLADERPAR
jgi:hypothetical protein